MTFNYDLLLEYLSYKHSGSYQDFKQYVKNLDYDDNINAGDVRYILSSLGHVEFSFCNDSAFYITPPAIALFENSYKGVLTGKRTQKLLNNLKEICKNIGIKYQEDHDTFNSPTIITVDFIDKEHLADFQKYDTGITITENFSLRLMNVVPDITNVINKSEYLTKIDDNLETVYRYNCKTYKFEPLKYPIYMDKEYTLYEIRKSFSGNYSYYIYENDKYYKIDRNYGICIVLANEFKYKKFIKLKGNELIVTNISTFPELIERALTLSSGYIKKSADCQNQYIYGKISRELAVLLSKKTGLKIDYE